MRVDYLTAAAVSIVLCGASAAAQQNPSPTMPQGMNETERMREGQIMSGQVSHIRDQRALAEDREAHWQAVAEQDEHDMAALQKQLTEANEHAAARMEMISLLQGELDKLKAAPLTSGRPPAAAVAPTSSP